VNLSKTADCTACKNKCCETLHEARNGLLSAMGIAIAIERDGATEELLEQLYEQHRRIGLALNKCWRE